MEKWIRWQIAKLLDRREDTCWAELAIWAIFPENHDFWEILDVPLRGICKEEDRGTYCGKCDVIDMRIFIRSGKWIAYCEKEADV